MALVYRFAFGAGKKKIARRENFFRPAGAVPELAEETGDFDRTARPAPVDNLSDSRSAATPPRRRERFRGTVSEKTVPPVE